MTEQLLEFALSHLFDHLFFNFAKVRGRIVKHYAKYVERIRKHRVNETVSYRNSRHRHTLPTFLSTASAEESTKEPSPESKEPEEGVEEPY